MTGVAARARGRTGALLAGDVLAELDRAADAAALAAALARGGLALPARMPDEAGAQLAGRVDQLARERTATDLALLARWTSALVPVMLDEDRRSVRAIVRGIAAGAPAERRLAAAVPTPLLPGKALAALAGADTVDQLAEQLARQGHPLAAALARPRTHADRGPLEPTATLELELALARRFAELARPRDRALRTYVRQALDAENAAAALLLAARGADLPPERAFLAGGDRLGRDAFLAAAAAPFDDACQRLADAFAGTPLARAVFEPAPAALEDAALAWQLDTQARLRRSEPLGLAPAVYLVLRRRDEARHLRRAAWRIALGAAA